VVVFIHEPRFADQDIAIQGLSCAEQVLKRKSGVSLSTPVPAIYSSAVFREAVATRLAVLVKQFVADGCEGVREFADAFAAALGKASGGPQ